MADAAWKSFEEPHVRAWRREFDVAQPLTADLRKRHFHSALIPHAPPVLHALVLAAEALPVSDRTENAGAKQAIALGLKSAVVDGFGLRHLAMRPAADFFRRGQADANGVEISNRICQIKRARTEQGFLHS